MARVKCGDPLCPGLGDGPVGFSHPCQGCGIYLHGICGSAPDPEDDPMRRICTECQPRAGAPQPGAGRDDADAAPRPVPTWDFFRSSGAQAAGLPNAAKHERPRKQKAPPKPASTTQTQPKKAKPSSSKPSASSRDNAVIRLNSLKDDERPNFKIDSSNATRLFCLACRKPVRVGRQYQLDQHCKTDIHKTGKATLARERVEDGQRKALVCEYFGAQLEAPGASLSSSTRAARLEATEIFMEAGIALDKVGTHPRLRRIVERGLENTLGDVSDLRRDFVPLVERGEQERTRGELLYERIALTYDSSYRRGDATVVVASCCTRDFTLKSRLLACTTFEKHMTGKQLMTYLQKLILTVYAFEGENILGGPRDGSSVNGAAAVRLTSAFPRFCDLICLPHTLSCAGDRIGLTTLDIFMTAWVSLVSPPGPAHMLWLSLTGYAPKSYSETRWHSKAECAIAILDKRRHLPAFMRALRTNDIGGSHTNTMCDIVQNEERQLILEMAALRDAGRPIVRATFRLEGTGLEILLAHDEINALLERGAALADSTRNGGLMQQTDALLEEYSRIEVGQLVQRNVKNAYSRGTDVQHGTITAVEDGAVTVDWSDSRTATRSEAHIETLPSADVEPLLNSWAAARRAELVAAVSPAYGYLRGRVEGDCSDIYSLVDTMKLLDAVRIFDPMFVKLHRARLSDDSVRQLCELPAFDDASLCSGLLEEASSYAALVASDEIDRSDSKRFTEDVLSWWRVNGSKIPTWSKCARIGFAYKPSSAQAERVFSMLKAMFTPQQMAALMDMVQGSIMMRYNGRGAL